MVSVVPDFPDYAKRLIKSTPEGIIIDWPLMWRNPQPVTASPLGHIIQAGDAAHTFLPASGSGVSQGIEDGIYLATCLQLAGKANIAWGMKVCNKLRYVKGLFNAIAAPLFPLSPQPFPYFAVGIH